MIGGKPSRQGRRWKRPVVRGMVLALALAVLPAHSQDEEDLVKRIREIRIVLNLGAVAFEELDFARAIRDLSRILEPFAAGRLGLLSSEESRLLARALELRARSYFNLGETENAEEDFSALIRLQVDYQLDRQQISPKVIDLWEKVRSRLVSTLSVQVDPIGAEVVLDEQVAGFGPRLEKDVVVGPHRIRVQHPGYEAFEETVEIQSGVILSRQIRLVRNSRDVRFVTVPNGVQVFLDGRPAGTTYGEAPVSYEETARKYSFPRREASEPLMVMNLSPGIHEIRFERDCFVPRSVRVEVRLEPGNEEPQDFQPVLLERSEGTLMVQGIPGGKILMDGRPAGTVPARLDGVCAGPHRLEVRGPGSSRWFDRIDLQRGQRFELDARPRPTLAYLGIFTADRDGEIRIWEEDPLAEEIADLDRFNRILPHGSNPAAESGPDRAAAPDPAARLRALVTDVLSLAGKEIWARTGPVDDQARKLAREELRADLLLVGTLPPGRLREELVLFLYETSLVEPDRAVIREFPDMDAVRGYLKRLSRPFELYGSWFGASGVDTLISDAPVVVRVSPGSPAGEAGIRPGAQIVAIESRQVRRTGEIDRALREVRAGDRLSVRTRDGEEVRDHPILISRTPRLLLERDPDLLYTKLVSELRHRSQQEASPEEKNFVLLNLGLAYMHFGEYERAVQEALGKIDLPEGPGISYGTVQYYLGMCYRKIGREGKAREAFRNASRQEASTLGSNDGPLVAHRAERLLRDLP